MLAVWPGSEQIQILKKMRWVHPNGHQAATQPLVVMRRSMQQQVNLCCLTRGFGAGLVGQGLGINNRIKPAKSSEEF